MNWFNRIIECFMGPDKKPGTIVQIKLIDRVPTGNKVVVADAQKILYQKTLPINIPYKKNQVIMANLDTWNKLT